MVLATLTHSPQFTRNTCGAPQFCTHVRSVEGMVAGRRSEAQDERVSLEGLDPEDALRALLAVDPDVEPADTDDEDGEDGEGRSK